MKFKINVAYTIFFCLFLALNTEGVAQSLFRAGTTVGLNLAQLDGDFQQGYDRLGLALGLKAAVGFTKKYELSAELFYNQRGANPGNRSGFAVRELPISTINLHYADVLFMNNFYSKWLDNRGFYRYNWQVGFSYGRLLNASTSITRLQRNEVLLAESITQNYNSNDFSLVVGWSLFLQPRLGLTLRHAVSLNSLYKNDNYKPSLSASKRDFFSFTSYFFSAQVFYNFISPKVKVKKAKKAKT
jgi:Outer membrane protein beta-barrel domain